MDTAAPAHAPDPRRWQALALVCVAFFMTILDVSIVNVALPSIKESLNVSDTTLQWVLIAYSITFGGFLLLRGPAAEEQKASEGDRVRDEDPLQRRVADVQRFLDRRQRDVDDRHVEDRHEEGDADERERLPAARVRSVGGRGGIHHA